MPEPAFDYTIVGGGLQGCLAAHALAHHQPAARVLLLEQGAALCGNHTWSFHETDMPPAASAWLDRLVSVRWPGYVVRFPGYTRRVDLPYATITSDDLRAATMQLAAPQAPDSGVPLDVRCGVSCSAVSATSVVVCGDASGADGGETIHSRCVIDCRGLAARRGAPADVPAGVGFQSFIGLEYTTDGDWPAAEPTIMDVRGDQEEGFEFLYELPLSPSRVLLEYTRFSNEPACDESRAEAFIQQRFSEAGVKPAGVVRTERGCLPMPFALQGVGAGDAKPSGLVAGGYAGGWYHAATGYSMPLA
ncbi:MAG: lycopene cyclase family protein, partial [Planctomycetota bacterium]